MSVIAQTDNLVLTLLLKTITKLTQSFLILKLSRSGAGNYM